MRFSGLWAAKRSVGGVYVVFENNLTCYQDLSGVSNDLSFHCGF
ncbi:MAG: hypothetical protein WA395_13790 [Nitrososphaeraceae archaeon]